MSPNGLWATTNFIKNNRSENIEILIVRLKVILYPLAEIIKKTWNIISNILFLCSHKKYILHEALSQHI
jgi:hypothetical protein